MFSINTVIHETDPKEKRLLEIERLEDIDSWRIGRELHNEAGSEKDEITFKESLEFTSVNPSDEIEAINVCRVENEGGKIVRELAKFDNHEPYMTIVMELDSLDRLVQVRTLSSEYIFFNQLQNLVVSRRRISQTG